MLGKICIFIVYGQDQYELKQMQVLLPTHSLNQQQNKQTVVAKGQELNKFRITIELIIIMPYHKSLEFILFLKTASSRILNPFEMLNHYGCFVDIVQISNNKARLDFSIHNRQVYTQGGLNQWQLGNMAQSALSCSTWITDIQFT